MPHILFLATLFFAPIGSAHDHGGGGGYLPALEALERHLEVVREGAMGASTGVSDDELRRIGSSLLDAAYEEALEEIRVHGPPSVLDRVGAGLKRELVDRFNPVRVGRWILSQWASRGPAVAGGLFVSEMLEQVGLVYGATHPEWVILIPLSALHVWDVVGIGVGLGIVETGKAISRWKRNGGPEQYLEHLKAQRRALPVDWDKVIAVVGSTDLPIYEEGAFERRLPRWARMIAGPRALALADAGAAVPLWKLESGARAAGVDRSLFGAYRREHPAAYAALLVSALEKAGEDRAGASWRKPDVSEDSPDEQAQRLVWRLRAERARLLKDQVAVSAAGRRHLRAVLRELRSLLDGDRGLARLAATEPRAGGGEEAAWNALAAEGLRTQAALARLEAISVPGCGAILEAR